MYSFVLFCGYIFDLNMKTNLSFTCKQCEFINCCTQRVLAFNCKEYEFFMVLHHKFFSLFFFSRNIFFYSQYVKSKNTSFNFSLSHLLSAVFYTSIQQWHISANIYFFTEV